MSATTKTKIIQDLVSRTQDLPSRDKEKLNELLEYADNEIRNFHGNTTNYRAELKMIRFSPWSFQSSEAEFRTSWNSGKNALINLFKTIGDDPAIIAVPPEMRKEKKAESKPEPIPEPVPEPREAEIIPEPEPIIDPLIEEEKPVQLPESAKEEKEFEMVQDSPVAEAKESQPPKKSFFTRIGSFLKKAAQETSAATETPATPEPMEQTQAPEPQLRESEPLKEELPKLKPEPKPEKKPEPKPKPGKKFKHKKPGPKPQPKPEPKPEPEPEEALIPEPVVETSKEEKPYPKFEKKPRILVVHGHETTAKDKVVEMLKKVGCEAVLTREKANLQKTLMQKLTEYSDAQFAVIILTADDMGYKKDGKPKDAKVRARQEVIFEMGLLIGKLGRNKVVVLHPEKVGFELPSNYFDANYIGFDREGAWQNVLIEKLHSSGYTFDNKQLKEGKG